MKIVSHLNPKLFDSDIERVPNRDGFGIALKEAGENNKQIVALSADLTESTRTNLFAEAFPERFIQCGVAEQNMASVASGLAAVGKIPFITSYAMFSPGRNWEQVRTTIAYNNQNVKIIGAHSGVSVGPDGATHQAIEDIAIMRVIPNMVVIAPADIHEAKKAVLWAADYKGPVYIRLGRSPVPTVTGIGTPFESGKAQLLIERTKHSKQSVCLVTTGSTLHNGILAAKELDKIDISVSLLHTPTIKPLDVASLQEMAETHNLIVTIEEHQIVGGLGSAVTEYISEKHPMKVIRIGVNDQFGQSGEPEELISHYKIDAKSIVERIKNEIDYLN